MFRIYLTQKKNNLFINIFSDLFKQVYYSSIGLEKFKGKNISFPLVEFLVDKMYIFLYNYLFNNYIFFNRILYSLLKIKIFIFLYINILNNFNNFLLTIIDNNKKIKFKFDRVIFLNNLQHGGCKFIKPYF